MHILCELRESHAITAQKLREAGQDVHRQIAPPQRLFILDEIYDVREIEELYRYLCLLNTSAGGN